MTGENGTPVTPDWAPEPHPCILLNLVPRLRRLDVELPPTIVLGEN